MYHSIQIIPDAYGIFLNLSTSKKRGKNTWDDWHLIPSSRPLFNPPAPKNNFLDLPGANGSIDLSDVLSDKYPVYGDRTGSIEFYVMNGYEEWQTAYSDIMNYCHGERCKFILEDDPGFYYSGRVSVNAWKSEKDWSKITLDYQVDPFKYELFGSNEPWRWDPFSFVDGVINNFNFNGTNWEGFTIDNNNRTYDSDTQQYVNRVIKEVAVTRMPVIPSFSIQCTTPTISSSSYLRVYLLRFYSGGRRQITWHEYKTPADEHSPRSVEWQDMALVDFWHRYAYDGNVAYGDKDANGNIFPKMAIKFDCPENESFKIAATFRRGRL